MGARGPAKKPTKLRLLDGTHPERINTAEPVPAVGTPEPPKGMAADVRAVWDYTIAQLEAMDIATPADRDALVCYCEAVVAHRKASELLARSTVLVQGIHGNLVKNPALQVQRDSAQTVRAFAQEFGLTPSARTSIQTPGVPDEQNPFAGASTG